MRHCVPAAGTITGQAYEFTTHQPIAGATIYAGLWGSSQRYQTTSDASGTFTFTGVDAGNYSVWGEKWGYEFTGSSWADMTGATGASVNITAFQAVVRGKATYHGDPVANAGVRLYSRAATSDPWVYVRTQSTNSDGEYYFCNQSGAQYAVGFEGGWTSAGPMKPCFYDGASTVESATPLAFDLLATMSGIDLPLTMVDPSITGRVTRAGGSPLADTPVVLYVNSGGEWFPATPALTDDAGVYQFFGLPNGTYRVGTWPQPDRSVLTVPSFFATSGPSPSDVASASDVTVASDATASNIDIVAGTSSETLTRDVYEVDDLRTQAKTVTTGGSIQAHTLLPAGDDDWMSFQVTAGHTYRIETTTSPTFPQWTQYTDTYLYLYDSDGKTKITYNDDRPQDVRSLIQWTAPSTKTVYAKVTDYESATGWGSQRGAYGFCVTDLGSAIETGTVSGRVIDSVTATGVPGAEVAIGNHVCFADGQGYYRVDGLPAGSYDVSAEGAGYSDLSTTTAIPAAGDQITLDLPLAPSTPASARILGYAVGAYDNVPTATVTVVADESGATTSTLTNSDGRYEFQGMESGTYRVTFSKPGFVDASYVGVGVDASETVHRSGYLTQLGQIHGGIAASGALAGASVVVDGAEATKTASDGTYSVSNLALGLHTLKFSAVGYVAYSQGFSIDDADSLAIDATLTTRPVVPTKPVVKRSPSKSSLTYRRRHGRANFALGVNVRDVSGAPVRSALVYLQRSYDGRHWTKTYHLMTNASGTATKKLYGTTKQKMYYRWIVRPTSTHKQVVTAKQKVTIK